MDVRAGPHSGTGRRSRVTVPLQRSGLQAPCVEDRCAMPRQLTRYRRKAHVTRRLDRVKTELRYNKAYLGLQEASQPHLHLKDGTVYRQVRPTL